jgi:hypothetical protein
MKFNQSRPLTNATTPPMARYPRNPVLLAIFWALVFWGQTLQAQESGFSQDKLDSLVQEAKTRGDSTRGRSLALTSHAFLAIGLEVPVE